MPENKEAFKTKPADQFLVFVFKNEKCLIRALNAVVRRLRRSPTASDGEVYRHRSRESHLLYINAAAMTGCVGVSDLPRPRWSWTRDELIGLARDQLFPVVIGPEGKLNDEVDVSRFDKLRKKYTKAFWQLKQAEGRTERRRLSKIMSLIVTEVGEMTQELRDEFDALRAKLSAGR